MNHALDTLAAIGAAQRIASAAHAARTPIAHITIGDRLVPLALADHLSTAIEPSRAHEGVWSTVVSVQPSRMPDLAPGDQPPEERATTTARFLSSTAIADAEVRCTDGETWTVTDGIAVHVY